MASELHLETVDGGTLDLLKRLMADRQLEDFNLLGGTALALRLGHRKSVDLDLFRLTEFDSGQVAEHLKERYNTEIRQEIESAVYGKIGNVKIDMLTDPTPLVDKVENTAGIRMLSLRDIGAMKMIAIFDNGGRLKDFADMYALLEKHPLNTYLEYARQKYPGINLGVLKQSLLYHVDVNLNQKVEYIGKPVDWHTIVNRLREAFYTPGKVFEENIKLKGDQRTIKTRRLRRGHRPE
jgi:hypothetical protein